MPVTSTDMTPELSYKLDTIQSQLLDLSARTATLEAGVVIMKESALARDLALKNITQNMHEILVIVTVIKSVITTGSMIVQIVKGAASLVIAIGALWAFYFAAKSGMPFFSSGTGTGTGG